MNRILISGDSSVLLRSNNDFEFKLKAFNIKNEETVFKGRRIGIRIEGEVDAFGKLYDTHTNDKKDLRNLENKCLLSKLVTLFASDNISEEGKVNLEKLIGESSIFKKRGKHIESIREDDLKLIRLEVECAYYQQVGDIEKVIECYENMLKNKSIGVKYAEKLLRRLIIYQQGQGNDEKVNQYQDQIENIDSFKEVELEEVDLDVLKERILELVGDIGRKAISNKVKIIFRRELSKNDLLVLEEYLKIIKRSHNDDGASSAIDEIFWPQLGSDLFSRDNWNIFTNKRANFIANLLIDNNGDVDIEVIDLIKDLLKTKPLRQNFSKIHDSVLLETLNAIKSNHDIIDLLNNLNAPVRHLRNYDPRKHDIETLVRVSLGLNEQTSLTARHSKLVILSAMLSDLRQGPVGSCFVTSLAIIIHDRNPLRLARELRQIIENGKFENEIDNKIITYNIPKIYMSSEFSMKSHFHERPDWKKFFNFPGIRSVIEVAGYDLVKDEKKLEDMYDKVMREKDSFKKSSDVIKSFIHQFAMDRAGLDYEDFKNREQYESLVIKKSRLVMLLSDVQDKREINSIQEDIDEIIQELSNINSIFDKKFGVEVSLKSRFEFCDEFRQKLEINCLVSGGDNLLLNIWQYSIASVSGYMYRKEKITFIDDLKSMIASPPNTIAWSFRRLFSSRIGSLVNRFINTERWFSFFNLSEDATKSNVLYILKEILSESEDISNSFDKEKFYDEFEKNFNQKLYERLEIRFEDGLKLYDKTRATLTGLALPLTSPKEFGEAIFSIAYHAAEHIDAGNLRIKDGVLQKLSYAIRGIEDDNYENSGIAKSMMLLHDGMYQKKEELKMTFRKEISIIGGYAEGIIRDYVNVPYTVLRLSNEPEAFITEMVIKLNSMHKTGKLGNIDSKKQIIFPMKKPGHAFLLRPDMKMLAEVMKYSRVGAIKNWISKTIIEKNKPFIIGDMNWGSSEGHVLLVAIKDEKTNMLDFKCLRETGQVHCQLSTRSFDVFFFEKPIESAEVEHALVAPKKRTSNVLGVGSSEKRRRVEKHIEPIEIQIQSVMSNKDREEKNIENFASARKRSSDAENSLAKRRRVGYEEQKS